MKGLKTCGESIKLFSTDPKKALASGDDGSKDLIDPEESERLAPFFFSFLGRSLSAFLSTHTGVMANSSGSGRLRSLQGCVKSAHALLYLNKRPRNGERKGTWRDRT